jgi:hypothetical protein
MAGKVVAQGVGCDDFEMARIMRRDFLKRGQSALVLLDRDDLLRALEQEGAGEAARTGPDLDDGR